MLYRFLGTSGSNIVVMQVGDDVYAITTQGIIVWEFKNGKFTRGEA